MIDVLQLNWISDV